MKKSDIYFEHIEKDTFFASQFLKHLELALKYKKGRVHLIFCYFQSQIIGFQLKLANQAWPTFEVSID